MTSTLGVIAGLLAAGATAPKVLAGAIGVAVAATVGMGAGQWLSGSDKSVRGTLAMAGATFAGSVAPALPFAFGGSLVAVALVTSAATAVIGHFRGYLVTCVILLAVGAITVGLSVAVA